MLNEEQINQNYARYTTGLAKYFKNSNTLLSELGEKLLIAPASSVKSLHCAYPGGLIEHILEVVKCASKINKALDNPVSEESLMRVALISEIGKAELYLINTDKWQIDNQGKVYIFNEKLASMKVGERSAYYALKCGLELSDTEYQAIINYEKEEDASVKWHTNPIGKVLRYAIDIAIINEKNRA